MTLPDLGKTGESIKTRLTNLESTTSGHATQLGSHDSMIKSQGTRIDTLESTTTSQGSRLTTAEGTIKSQGTSITSLQSSKANLASPTFTGTPKAPTAASGTNTTQVATCAFVKAAVAVPQSYAEAIAEAFNTFNTTNGIK